VGEADEVEGEGEGAAESESLLVFPAQNGSRPVLKLFFQELVYREGDRLAGGDTHYARGDAFIEGVNTFLAISPQVSIFGKNDISFSRCSLDPSPFCKNR
jgi:hypothetical protein